MTATADTPAVCQRCKSILLLQILFVFEMQAGEIKPTEVGIFSSQLETWNALKANKPAK